MTVGFAQSIKDSLTRTRNTVFGRIAGLLGTSQVTDDTWDELEELLIQADVGVETTLYLVERLRRRAGKEAILQADVLQGVLREELRALLPDPSPLNLGNQPLDVILIVGVNGSGKTTRSPNWPTAISGRTNRCCWRLPTRSAPPRWTN